MRNAVAIVGLIASTLAGANVVAPSPLESNLHRELLAPCCYRETLDHHMSDAASAMKAEICEMVANGKTEHEIVELYKSRYGLRILAEPEGAR